ncbi:MAG: allophanate hydrolase subunit 1 [Litoreibacter sp.]
MTFPLFRAIADHGVLVEFGDHIDDAIHATAVAFDRRISNSNILGLTESVPSYAAVLVGYDPLVTDYDTICTALKPLLNIHEERSLTSSQNWEIPTCYDAKYATDKAEIEDRLNLSIEQIARFHAASTYKVYMYGFSPGVAYLGGTPAPIQVPRKPGPVMGIPAGAVMIAGPQSLIYTVTMPSGWWRIGQAAKTPLQDDPDRPFLFNVGDTVRFKPVTLDEFEAYPPL